jgi:hypothetical protein
MRRWGEDILKIPPVLLFEFEKLFKSLKNST